MRALLACLLCLTGCTGLSLRPVQRNHALRLQEVQEKLGVGAERLNTALAYTQAQCDATDTKVAVWTGTGVVSGALSGGSSLTSIFTGSPARYYVAGAGLGMSVLTAFSAFMSNHYSQIYSRRCTVNTGGQ